MNSVIRTEARQNRRQFMQASVAVAAGSLAANALAAPANREISCVVHWVQVYYNHITIAPVGEISEVDKNSTATSTRRKKAFTRA